MAVSSVKALVPTAVAAALLSQEFPSATLEADGTLFTVLIFGVGNYDAVTRIPEWMKRSQEMMDTGLAAWKAADAKNVDQLFTVGGDVYEACSKCHQQYMDAIKNANK